MSAGWSVARSNPVLAKCSHEEVTLGQQPYVSKIRPVRALGIFLRLLRHTDVALDADCPFLFAHNVDIIPKSVYSILQNLLMQHMNLQLH